MISNVKDFYFDRRIRVVKDKMFINLDRSYYVGEHFFDAVDININVDQDGRIFVCYEDCEMIEVGELDLDSEFRNSRFHASLINRDNDSFIVLHDIFQYEGVILSDARFEERLKILSRVDFIGEYAHCQIQIKNWYFLSQKDLASAVDYGVEFVLPETLISQYKGCYALTDEVQQVVFSSDGSLFAIEWEESTSLGSKVICRSECIESEQKMLKVESLDIEDLALARAVKRVRKQKYPILSFIFNPRKRNYSFTRRGENFGAVLEFSFSDIHPPISRRLFGYSNIYELVHSIFVELVCSYVVIGREIKKLECSLSERFVIIDNYFRNMKLNLEVLSIRFLKGSIPREFDGRLLIVRCHGDDYRVIQSLSRVRLKHVRYAFPRRESVVCDPGGDLLKEKK